MCPWVSYLPILSLGFFTYKNLPDGVIGKIKENVYKTPTMGSSTYKCLKIIAIIKIKNIVYVNATTCELLIFSCLVHVGPIDTFCYLCWPRYFRIPCESGG